MNLVAIMVEFTCKARDLNSIPGLERSPGERNSNLLQNSCLENSRDRGAWWAIVHGFTKSWTRLNNSHYYCVCVCVCVLIPQLCTTLCDPMDCSPPGNSLGKNTGVGCHFLFQRIFLPQGSNLGLPCFRQMLY